MQEAFVGIMLPLKSPANAQSDIAAYMNDLLKATVPQWKEGDAWLNTNTYPQAWEVQKTANDPLCQQAECLLDIKSPDQSAHIGFMRAVVAGDLDTEAFDAQLWDLRTQTIIGINLESKKIIQVGALSAVERVFSETDPLNEPQKAYVVNVIFVKKPYTYTFALSATTPADRDKAMADLAEMIASVQIGP